MPQLTSNTLAANGSYTVGITKGCSFSVAASGTFGSGTLKVQYAFSGEWKDFDGGDTGDFTEADERVFVNVGDADEVKLVLSGATGPDIDIVVTPQR